MAGKHKTREELERELAQAQARIADLERSQRESQTEAALRESKRAEEALRLSEEKFAKAFANNPAAIVITRLKDGLFLDVNDTWVAIMGYSRQEVIGRFSRPMHIWPTAEAADRFVQELRTNGFLRGWEQEFHKKSGETFVSQLCSQVLDVRGEQIILSTLVDITDRKRAEEALRQAHERLQYHVENSPLAVIEFDAQLRVTSWSDGAARVFGWQTSEVLGQWMWDVPWIFEEDRQKVKAISAALQNGTVTRNVSPNRNLRKDGSVVWCEWHNSTLLDAHGKMSSILSLVLDVTERTDAEQRLKELNATLEHRVAERTAEAHWRAEQLQALAAQLTQAEQNERQRLATVLHDHLQQLLVGTKFHLGMVRNQREDPELHQSLAEIDGLLDQSLETCRNLTVDLSPPILVHGNMAQVLRWLADWMRSKHGLHVKLRADERANPQSYEVRTLLFQVVRELLFNIVKHAKVGEATVELCQLDDQHVQVTVRDKGAGFDPSLRGHSHDGSGFGLFAIQERLDWLDGALRIDSRPGEGTSVVLTAPVVLAGSAGQMASPAGAASRAEPDGAHGAPSDRAQAGGKVRVLLADDHVVMRDGLGGLLQRLPDMEVVGKAADGQEAVDLALQLKPDVVIMDISMPRLDGIEATRRIKARLPQIQIIGLSMFNDEGAAANMKQAGAAGYMAKTSDPDALIALVRQCAGRR